MPREKIGGPDKDAEQDDDVSEGYEDVNWYAVRGRGGSEADKWESVISDVCENKELLEVEET